MGTKLTPEKRLALAEAVCLMYGWSPCHDETERDKATHELWSRWANAVPKTFLDGRNHPELDDDAVAGLASRRDAIREATFGNIAVLADNPPINAGSQTQRNADA